MIWRRRDTWLYTATGHRFYPLDPSPEDIYPEDVARGLANECRYAGQLSVDLDAAYSYYSVAEHSVLLSYHVPPRLAKLALLHDAAEAYLGDMPRPLKGLRAFRAYRRIEARCERVIFERFGLHPTHANLAEMKRFDTRILSDEIPLLMREETAPRERPLGADVRCLPPHLAERAWLARFYDLFPKGCWNKAACSDVVPR